LQSFDSDINIMAVEIFIARHGQNEDNKRGVLNGHRDLPLTDLGRDQARQLGQGILDAGLEFDAIYCSPLSRAHETAQIICRVMGIEARPIVIPELIERDFGVMTGKRIDQITTLCSPNILKTDTITYFINPEGAETFPQLVERGKKAIDTIRSRQITGKVLLVCHGDIGKMIYAAASGKPWANVLTNFHFGNCDLIEVDNNNEVHKIKLLQHNL
jgi:broad specificity phosphatase PhoE